MHAAVPSFYVDSAFELSCLTSPSCFVFKAPFKFIDSKQDIEYENCFKKSPRKEKKCVFIGVCRVL